MPSLKTPKAALLAAFLSASGLALSPASNANAGSQPAPLTGPARVVIEEFLAPQLIALPGKASLRVDTPVSGPPPACAALEAFLPAGARLWGRLSIGLRCNSEPVWTRYMPAYVAITQSYYAAARQINAGQTLTAADIEQRVGDLSSLPASVLLEPTLLHGAVANYAIALGAPLRKELLRTAARVRRGQAVKLLSRGSGFTVSVDGTALTDAALGAIVQVKIESGQVLSGVVRDDGVVERAN